MTTSNHSGNNQQEATPAVPDLDKLFAEIRKLSATSRNEWQHASNNGIAPWDSPIL